MKPIASLAIFLALIVAVVTPSHAAKRVALVVGNSTYQHTPALPNPKNDAKDMAAALQRLGFEVQLGIDLDESEFTRAVRAFSRKATGAETSLFYYAGHGLQYEGNNYLVPVDARLTDEADLTFEALKLNDVLRLMERASQVSLIFLDACRDNPLARNLANRLGPDRSTVVGRGLAVVENVVGTLIAFATQPGNVAQDGTGRNSPFTKALLKHVDKPGLDISQLLRLVRDDVIADTRGLQVPWDHSSLKGGAYYLNQASPSIAIKTDSEAKIPLTAQHEVAFWETIRESNNVELFQEYLRKFPSGAFSGLAQIRISALTNSGAPSKLPSDEDTLTGAAPSTKQAVLEKPEMETPTSYIEDIGALDGRWLAHNRPWHAELLIENGKVELGVWHDQSGQRMKGDGTVSKDGKLEGFITLRGGSWATRWAEGSVREMKFSGSGGLGKIATLKFQKVE
jgi:hypothetical protein